MKSGMQYSRSLWDTHVFEKSIEFSILKHHVYRTNSNNNKNRTMKATYLHLIALPVYNRLTLMTYVMWSPVIVCYFRCPEQCDVMHTGTVQILLKLQNMTHLTHVSGDNSQCLGKKKWLQMSEQFLGVKSKNCCGIFHVSQNIDCLVVEHLFTDLT